jgi:hypothetical protein
MGSIIDLGSNGLDASNSSAHHLNLSRSMIDAEPAHLFSKSEMERWLQHNAIQFEIL